MRTDDYGKQLVPWEPVTISSVVKRQGEGNYFFSSAASNASKLNFIAALRARSLGVKGRIFIDVLLPEHLAHKLI
jgi:hypothetical protein